MQDVSNKLLLTSWLDDQRGPARLTARQQELLSQMEILTHDGDKLAPDLIPTSHHPSEPTDVTSSLINLLKPQWDPNEIINMFHEEKLKIVERGLACNELLAEVESVCDKLQSLKDLYQFVSPRTSQLHSECKSLIRERADLQESLEKINTNLSKHEELRSICKRMPDIKNQILTVLNKVFTNFQNYNDDCGTALDEFYGRFFIECRRIKELTRQLESCICTSNTDELLLHLEEVYTIYFDIREQLITPLFSKNLKEIIAKCNRNYCDLLRQTSLSAIKILRNEIQLFNQIFSVPSPTEQANELQPMPHHPVKKQALNNFLEMLCKSLYDHLRPVVIHINHIETLAELFKLINDNMLNEMPEEAYVNCLRALAQDVQERMVFRTEIFIKESLLEYKPSSGDLAFKEILEIVGNDDFKNYQSLWYPTVQRSVQTLFYLNRVFDAVTLRELAQELSIACLKSLDEAQRLIDERYKNTKNMKPNLFKTKHEAILREQLKTYGMEEILDIKPEDTRPAIFGKNLPVLGNFLY